MSGFIVKETVKENKGLVIELYGVEVFNACLAADDKMTFLAILVKFGKI